MKTESAKTYTPPRIYNSILEVIGHTPLIRLNKIPKEEGVECEIFAKCEYLNPTGSHKDRLALNLIESAEKKGALKPGGSIVEASSGNTGLALSFVASMKGYKAIIAATPKASQEKCDLMRGFGADVIKAKSNASKASDGVFALAKQLVAEIPGAFYADQFYNPDNPATHYNRTAEEIYDQVEGKLNYLFMSAGTGGTISGTGKKLKEKIPGMKVVGCDPIGSLIAGSVYIPFKVEGVGYDFVPGNCDLKVMDSWVKFSDKDAFDYARRLMREEGLMVGGSAGGNLWSAIEFAKKNKLTSKDRIVVVMPDTNRNYLTKHVSDVWYYENGFFTEDEYRREAIPAKEGRLGDSLTLKCLGCPKIIILKIGTSIADIWSLLKKEPILLIAEKEGDTKTLKGVVQSKDVLYYFSTKKIALTDPVDKIMKTEVCTLSINIKLSTASKILESREYILGLDETAPGSVHYILAGDILGKLIEIEGKSQSKEKKEEKKI